MTEPLKSADVVVVTAKRLDSDELSEETIEVRAPQSELAMREQLKDLVGALYPNAEFRSFANGAASFLAPKMLVVAIYRLASEQGATSGEDDESQQQLFAA